MAMCIIMPNGKSLSTKCTLIITHLIKAKLAAISTCLFAHNCQHRGKVGFRKQNQSHLSSISSASNRMLKEEEVWFIFERESFRLSPRQTDKHPILNLFPLSMEISVKTQKKGNASVDTAVIT